MIAQDTATPLIGRIDTVNQRPQRHIRGMTLFLFFHKPLLLRSYLYHCIWSVITGHNLTPEKRDDNGWRRGVVANSVVRRMNEVRTLGPVSTGMDDHLWAGIPSRCVTGQLG